MMSFLSFFMGYYLNFFMSIAKVNKRVIKGVFGTHQGGHKMKGCLSKEIF